MLPLTTTTQPAAATAPAARRSRQPAELLGCGRTRTRSSPPAPEPLSGALRLRGRATPAFAGLRACPSDRSGVQGQAA